MALERIVGQPRAIELLRRALVTDRVAHGYAFVGPVGSGRMATAQALAQTLLCERRAPETAEACGGCRGCTLTARGQHPDLHVITPTPPEKNPKGARAIRIGDVRQLERQASLRPAMGAWKVFIVDEADRMTDDAPQAFLKTLEEPPPRTVIVLVLVRRRAVPATVLSRCHIVGFAPRPDEATDAARAGAASFFAEVATRGAEALFRRLTTLDREKAEALVDAYWLYCRDLVVARAGGPAALLVNRERADDIAREAERWTLDELFEEIAACRAAREGLLTNVNARLTVEVLLSRLALRAA